MTDEERKELQESIKKIKEEKALKEQSKIDAQLISEAKELGIDIEKFEKKPKSEEEKSSEKNTSVDIEKLAVSIATATATAINSSKGNEEKKDVVTIHG